MAFLQSSPSLQKTPQFLGMKSTPNLLAPTLIPRKGNEAPLWELSLINPHRAEGFRNHARHIINPNSLTIAKKVPGLHFSSFSLNTMLENRAPIAFIQQQEKRVQVTPEYFSKSIPNMLRGQPKPKKDAVMQMEEDDVHIYGVCDGHGVIAGEISQFVARTLPGIILRRHTTTDDSMEKVIKASFSDMQREVIREFAIAAESSGCTCVCVVLVNSTMYCANIGDSRAIVARKYGSSWIGIPLSEDHKPSRILEASRIVRLGGKVEPLKDAKNEPFGPPLVWVEGKNIPGLTVTRSFGDSLAHAIGVSKEPEILTLPIIKEDRIVVLATDGVWAVMETQEVAELVSRFAVLGVARDCCTQVVDTALSKWSGRGDYIDDISVIVVFLQ